MPAAAKHRAGFVVDPGSFTCTLDAQNALREHPLDASQAELARQFACGGSRIQVGIGPAGPVQEEPDVSLDRV